MSARANSGFPLEPDPVVDAKGLDEGVDIRCSVAREGVFNHHEGIEQGEGAMPVDGDPACEVRNRPGDPGLRSVAPETVMAAGTRYGPGR